MRLGHGLSRLLRLGFSLRWTGVAHWFSRQDTAPQTTVSVTVGKKMMHMMLHVGIWVFIFGRLLFIQAALVISDRFLLPDARERKKMRCRRNVQVSARGRRQIQKTFAPFGISVFSILRTWNARAAAARPQSICGRSSVLVGKRAKRTWSKRASAANCCYEDWSSRNSARSSVGQSRGLVRSAFGVPMRKLNPIT